MTTLVKFSLRKQIDASLQCAQEPLQRAILDFNQMTAAQLTELAQESRAHLIAAEQLLKELEQQELEESER